MLDAKIIYNNYPVRVQEYMENVIQCLYDDYGNIPDAWRISLDLIADHYNIYLQCLDDIKKRGIVMKGRTGEYVKNCSFTILDRSAATMRELMKSFCLTPMSKAKMKAAGFFSDEEEKEDDYLESLRY